MHRRDRQGALGSAEIRAAFDREYSRRGVTARVRRPPHAAQRGGSVERMVGAAGDRRGRMSSSPARARSRWTPFVPAHCAKALGFDVHVQNYHEHWRRQRLRTRPAVAYVQLRVGSDRTVYGVGFDSQPSSTATLRAVVCAGQPRRLQRDWLLAAARRERPVHA
jgi:hypothetical protein